jgi:hypothetical protein
LALITAETVVTMLGTVIVVRFRFMLGTDTMADAKEGGRRDGAHRLALCSKADVKLITSLAIHPAIEQAMGPQSQDNLSELGRWAGRVERRDSPAGAMQEDRHPTVCKPGDAPGDWTSNGTAKVKAT